MSSFTVVGTSRLGAEPTCTACRAGAATSFNWAYASDRNTVEDREHLSLFVPWKDLRRGWLYRCRLCEQCWHLDGDRQTMTHVADERLPLVLEWNKEPIVLSHGLTEVLDTISPTPPDVYGNGSAHGLTPCMAETKAGERFELAMVCIQKDAPVQDYWNCRLASEILQVAPSPYALPLEVRVASSQAEETRMGFSPSLIEMPDGRRFVLNGRTSFMKEPGYRAEDARVATGSHFPEDPPPTFPATPDGVVYFIADGDPAP